jgi:hypothetical protein
LLLGLPAGSFRHFLTPTAHGLLVLDAGVAQKSRRQPGKLQAGPWGAPSGARRGLRGKPGKAARPGPQRTAGCPRACYVRRACHDYRVMDATTRLGVPADADAGTVRAAFARQMRAVHPDIAGPRQGDPAADVASLIAARDHLLARAKPAPGPQTGPVVFVQDRDLLGSLRQLLYRRKQPRRHLG